MGLWQLVFGKKKRQQQGEDAIYQIEEPFIAHRILRLEPKEYNGVETDGVIGGPFEDMTVPELESWPKSKFGGGRYRARIHSQGQGQDTKGKYLCLHTWKLPGVPLIDGKEILRQEKSSKGKVAASKEVDRIKEEEEMFVARNARDRREAEWLKTRKESGLDGDDGNEYEEEEEEDSEKDALRAKVEEMEEKMKEGERRRHEEEKERKWHDEMKAMSEKSDKRFEAMREESDKRFETMMAKLEEQKQDNSMQMMMKTSKELTQQMIALLSNPSTASKEASESRQQLINVLTAQNEQRRNEGNTSVKGALDLFTTAMEIASRTNAGGAESIWGEVLRKTLPEIASGIKEAVSTVVQANKTPQLPASPVDAGRITAIAKQGAEQAIKQEAQRKLQTTDTAVSTTGVAENPVVVKEPEAPQEEKKMSREEILAVRRKAMINEFLEILAVEIKELTNDPAWPNFAYNNLPKDVLDIMRGISDLNDLSKLADVLRKDGDEKLVNETLVEIKKDPVTVKWLWKWIQEIQEADTEPDGNVDTTDE